MDFRRTADDRLADNQFITKVVGLARQYHVAWECLSDSNAVIFAAAESFEVSTDQSILGIALDLVAAAGWSDGAGASSSITCAAPFLTHPLP